jgi:hypothetical protein
MAVASKQGGGLNLAINARMYQTSLTSQYSSNVLNAQQQITISSTVNYETYVLISFFVFKPWDRSKRKLKHKPKKIFLTF